MIAGRYASRRTPFDTDFELADDSAIYCTELVWICYREAGLRATSADRVLFPSELLNQGFFEPVPVVHRE